ncbi:MAG: hypothetical protein FJ286_07900 [Planctomycetes bacterium]|nr:hypothetical protein [Planctomycetota bacterium]
MNRRRFLNKSLLLPLASGLALPAGPARSASAPARRGPDAEVRMHRGRPAIFIDGAPVALPGYSPGSTRRDYDTFMPLFYEKRMGMYLVWIDGWGTSVENRWWNGDTVSATPLSAPPPDAFTLEQQVGRILAGDPRAYLVIRFYTRPPGDWARLHPDEFAVNEDGQPMPSTPSFASDLFWEQAAAFGAALVTYCEAQSWGHRVIGYNTHYLEEGSYMPIASGFLFDHGPRMTDRYRRFLREKYGTTENLRAAHHDPEVTLDTAAVPRDRLRGNAADVAGIHYWLPARENQPLRDYLELTRDLFHERFAGCGRAMEAASSRKVLILHDALKQVMQGWNNYGFFRYDSEGVSWSPAYPEMLAGSGHMNVAELLDSAPGFSGILTPHDYQARGVGGVYEPEGAADSAVLRGKYFLAEMDTRSGPTDIAPARDPREWAAITWRNYATGWARGFDSYWMYGFFIADWFGAPAVQDTIRRQVEVIRQSIDWTHEPVPGIAMILDDTAVLETNGSGNYLNEAVMWEWKMGLARCGVPHSIHLLEDLAHERFPDHRVYYFPNLFRVDERRLGLLRRKVFRAGNVVVWGPGSGISDGVVIGTESAARLTGFSFEMIPANAQRRILISNFEHPVTRGLDESLVIGGPLAYGPVIMPTDGTELGLAWAKGGNHHRGLALKEFGRGAAGRPEGGPERGPGDYAAIFTTAVQLPADLWRSVARYAGAHVYTESNDVIMASRGLVALHSLKSGPKRITLPELRRVTDLVSGAGFAATTAEITFDLDAPETRVFLLEEP